LRPIRSRGSAERWRSSANPSIVPTAAASAHLMASGSVARTIASAPSSAMSTTINPSQREGLSSISSISV